MTLIASAKLPALRHYYLQPSGMIRYKDVAEHGRRYDENSRRRPTGDAFRRSWVGCYEVMTAASTAMWMDDREVDSSIEQLACDATHAVGLRPGLLAYWPDRCEEALISSPKS